MRFQVILFGVRFFTLLSLLAWMGVLFFVDPDISGVPGSALFLGTLFSFLAGCFSLLLIGLSRKILGDASAAVSFGALSRQGFLLALFAIAILALFRVQLFSWWNALLVFAAILLIELTARRFSGGSDEKP